MATVPRSWLVIEMFGPCFQVPSTRNSFRSHTETRELAYESLAQQRRSPNNFHRQFASLTAITPHGARKWCRGALFTSNELSKPASNLCLRTMFVRSVNGGKS